MNEMLPCWVARQVLGLYSWTSYWYLLPNRRSAIKRLTWQIASDSFAASSRHKVVLGLANHHYLRAAFIQSSIHSVEHSFIPGRAHSFAALLLLLIAQVVSQRPKIQLSGKYVVFAIFLLACSFIWPPYCVMMTKCSCWPGLSLSLSGRVVGQGSIGCWHA